MKTFPALYIDPQGVVRYNLFPEEPERTDYEYYYEIAWANTRDLYRSALQTAKDSAIELKNNYPNAKELFDCLKALGVDPVQAPKWLNERKGQVIPLPSGWDVEVKEELIGSQVAKASGVPLDFERTYKKVAVLIPPPTSEQDPDKMFKEWIGGEQEESQDDLWVDLLKTMGFFPAPKYLIEVKEKFNLTRR